MFQNVSVCLVVILVWRRPVECDELAEDIKMIKLSYQMEDLFVKSNFFLVTNFHRSEKPYFNIVDIELQLLMTRCRDNDTFDELSFFSLIKRICVPVLTFFEFP
jgi:hypothetical protein